MALGNVIETLGFRRHVEVIPMSQYPTKELSVVDAVHTIKHLDYPFAYLSHLDNHCRARILLAYTGTRPIAWEDLTGEWPQSDVDIIQWTNDTRLLAFEHTISALGFNGVYIRKKDSMMSGGWSTPACIVGKKMDDVMKGVEALRLSGIRGDRAMGAALGYPKSAVDAWPDKLMTREDEIRMGLYDNNPVLFGLSRMHAAEELQVIKKWTAVIRTYWNITE